MKRKAESAPGAAPGPGSDRDRRRAEAVAALLDDDDDATAGAGGAGRADDGGQEASALRKGADCPYLDTISRAALDFDFEKCCSVSLSNLNVYGCLVCGKYFQGRGKASHAYTHSLEAGHHVWIHLDSERVYCLPDAYEVVDRSLDDIRQVLNPRFSAEAVASLDGAKTWARALDGSDYLPGTVGLNNLKATDYANCVLQSLARVRPLRDFFLLPASYVGCRSPLVCQFGALMRKCWNGRSFRGHVSPHEFLQAVMAASSKRFTVDRQADPVDFLLWLLAALHSDLAAAKPGARLKGTERSIITDCFQGELEVTAVGDGGGGGAVRQPFMLLGLDLPAAPLFKDAMEQNIIPQVPLHSLLGKFDGKTVHEAIGARGGRKTYALVRLPPYLLVHVRRFTKNNFFVEKNPTLVSFPVRNLELRESIPLPPGVPSRYDLAANVCHDGKPGPGEGTYRTHVHRRADGAWYEVQDLTITELLPQVVALSESYLQVYERQGAELGAGEAGGGQARPSA